MTSAGEERLIGVGDNGDEIPATGKYTGNGKCMINDDDRGKLSRENSAKESGLVSGTRVVLIPTTLVWGKTVLVVKGVV